MTPLASLSPSQSRPAGLVNLASPRGQVDPQATLANRLANRLGLEPGALDGKREDFTPDKVADRVLGFIEQRLRSEAAAGADPAKLMVAGDSAGGSLTNACVLQDEKGIIRKIMGIYPSWDGSDYHEQTAYTWSYDAYEVADEDKKLAYSRIDRIKSGVDKDPDSSNSLYLQGHTTSHDPLVSAVFATDEQLKKFPETVIVAAEYDYLRVGSDYAAKRLASLGVPVRSIRYCGCDHGFLDMLGTIVQSEELCLTIAAELKAL